MPKRDIHDSYDFFEYVRLTDSTPAADRTKIDIALLDMNHSWLNVGHDSVVHAVLEVAEGMRERLVAAGLKVRVLSYDVRRQLLLPDAPNGRFQLYVGTGGPGHLDPRLNDGKSQVSQGIAESAAWEAPLFHLYDSILANDAAAMLAICHSFGLVCRWSGIAHPEVREEKSSGMPVNALSDEAAKHPWFSQFAERLADGRHFTVVDNRLFDLVLDRDDDALPIAFEEEGSRGLTMVELARDPSGQMPRFLGVNHHPEIIDRDHIMVVLEEKRVHHEATESWYHERVTTMRDLFQGESERQSRLTSHFTLLGPLQFHLERIVDGRAA
jgi:hypothetical protein